MTTTKKQKVVALIGGGKLAKAALALLNRGGNVEVLAHARDAAQRLALKEAGATIAASPSAAVERASLVFLCVPATAFVDVVDSVSSVARGDQVVLHAARGLGEGCALPHEMIRARSCWKKIAALGGPLYVDDAAAGRPLNAAVGSRFDEAARAVRDLTGFAVRFSSTRDIVGVEVAGALSNVGHLAAGLAKGAGFGETEQGLLTVRALLEAARLGVLLGAERSTFNGLAGIGDLIPRNLTSTRTHRAYGEDFAKGVLHDDIAELEGAFTARQVSELCVKSGIELPLTTTIHDVLLGKKQAKEALDRILSLELGLAAA